MGAAGPLGCLLQSGNDPCAPDEPPEQKQNHRSTPGPTHDQLTVSLKEQNHLYLHEEAGAERLADVDVVVSAGEFCAPAGQVEAVHDPGQLLPHVVRGH